MSSLRHQPFAFDGLGHGCGNLELRLTRHGQAERACAMSRTLATGQELPFVKRTANGRSQPLSEVRSEHFVGREQAVPSTHLSPSVRLFNLPFSHRRPWSFAAGRLGLTPHQFLQAKKPDAGRPQELSSSHEVA